MAKSRRILVVTRNLPPLVGGMERLNWHLIQGLSKSHDVRVIGPFGSAVLLPSGVRCWEVPIKPLWKFLISSQLATLFEALRWRPHIIVAGSGLTAVAALVSARLSGAKSIAYVHGLDVAVENWLYQKVWFPALRRFDKVVANSRATRLLAEGMGVGPGHLELIFPGVDLPEAHISTSELDEFREMHALQRKCILLSVGRLTERKGMLQFVRFALPQIVKEVPDVVLLCIGGASDDSLLARNQSPQAIQAAAVEAGIEKNLKFIGTITDPAILAQAYRAADLHVFPVRELDGDPEGFGMVAIEAAAQGLRTVAFLTGGTPDSVSDGISGVLVAAGDYQGFAATVIEQLRRGATAEDEGAARQFAESFSWVRFSAAFNEVVQACLSERLEMRQ